MTSMEKRCKEAILKIEEAVLRIANVVQDIDMKLTHLIECKKNNRYKGYNKEVNHY